MSTLESRAKLLECKFATTRSSCRATCEAPCSDLTTGGLSGAGTAQPTANIANNNAMVR